MHKSAVSTALSSFRYNSAYFLLFIMSNLFIESHTFKWALYNSLPPRKIITFSERYIFAGHSGPILLEQGDSYIDPAWLSTWRISTTDPLQLQPAGYGSIDSHFHDASQGTCGEIDVEPISMHLT